MRYSNSLEGKLASLESELRVAEMNNWEFDVSTLKDEIREIGMQLENEFKEAYEG